MKVYLPNWIPMELVDDWCYGLPYRILKNGMLIFDTDWLIYFNKNRYIVVPEAVARRYVLESFIVRPRGDHWLVF